MEFVKTRSQAKITNPAIPTHDLKSFASRSNLSRLSRNDAVRLGARGVSPALFGVPPKTPPLKMNAPFGDGWLRRGRVGGTPTGATGTVALPISTASFRLRSRLKNPERGCVVLDQPQPASIFQPKRLPAACGGWSSTQPRSFFRPALRDFAICRPCKILLRLGWTRRKMASNSRWQY